MPKNHLKTITRSKVINKIEMEWKSKILQIQQFYEVGRSY